ncbi:MAG: Rieske (2Fe-2S) protein [Myxococcaceae bacterium]|jgi:3-phenylpropionate/trans-cinnamate dioxygenase ferredoxin subunit|nr:Rieske (2Fe-2S) protein [Myxococcaceae bacterium]
MSESRITLGPANLQEGELRGYAVGKRNVLIACVGGKVKALDDWCNHAGCLLSGGRIENNLVICPCHEVGFDLDTGANATSPGVCDDQPAFKTEIDAGQIVVIGFDPNR